MPVLASTPEQENAPLANEDELFLGEMSQLSEEELINIIGQVIIDDGASPAGATDLGAQPHTAWYNKQVTELAKKIKKIIYISGSVLVVGGALTTFLTGTTISVATLISLISIDAGAILEPIIDAYLLTEALNALAQWLGGSDNVVTITGTLISGISNYLAEVIYNS